ncbi:BIG GRAIN LIKE 1 [Hibiscus trionum]|uniref:BIG GRAIN LIKE 1 n=1 Tax=Hibiscus trionum TaxID=183268 RepID=A0A9W7JF01_HIBTR|nr:BIG GRAIN LIKE 1 [Hibiscus trionum]
MSVTGVSDPDRMSKKSFHRRNGSGELDVFEAAWYFSGYNDAASYNCATFSQKMIGRASLDVPMTMRNPLPQQAHVVEKQSKDKKYKQPTPSSPGGRFASFFNSFFNQTGSKKKKSKSTSQSMKDEEESPGGRRRRRSSISHLRSSSMTDNKSFYSSSSSGFRIPPPYPHTPTKSYKEFRSYSDQKQVSSLSKNNIGPTKITALQNAVIGDKRNTNTTDYSWSEEKLRFNNGNSEKHENTGVRHQEKCLNYSDRYPSDEKETGKFNETDDGAESDSSSDLFELPVYETTHMDTIKRGAPISNPAL